MASVQNQGEQQASKLSHKQWKKLKRKQKRQAQALQKKEKAAPSSEGTDAEEEERLRRKIEEENERENAEWERRDREAHQQWLEKKEQEEREKKKREEQERKIREEWEERERKEKEEMEKREKAQHERQEKQDSLLKKATENEHKDWHNPLAPASYNSGVPASNGEIVRDVNRCPFFTKTGACRFGDRCSRVHVRPDSSTTILIPGMFESFELKKSSTDDYDTDINLEYEDSELFRSFRDFYHDVVPEFKSVGRLVNFKVCCNQEPHLRGNVYVQYKRESDAQSAFVKFNARWYAGRQLSCEFVNIAKWKSAICGLFFSKRCPKGAACNFLHVFRNPGNEFWEADRDFENSSWRDGRGQEGTPRWYPPSDRRSHSRRRSRSRSRTRESSRSQSSRYRSTKDRSRSPVARSRRSAERDGSRRSAERDGSRRKRGRSPSQTGRDRSRSKDPSPYRSSDKSSKKRHRSGSRSASPVKEKEGRFRSPSVESTQGREKKSTRNPNTKSPKSPARRRSMAPSLQCQEKSAWTTSKTVTTVLRPL